MNTFFYIRKTKDKNIGIIYKGTSQGTLVLSRTSTKIKIPMKAWDEKKSTIKSINGYDSHEDLLELQKWRQNNNPNDAETKKSITLADNSCFIKYCQKQIQNSQTHKLETKQKYIVIINSLIRYANYVFQSNLLPFKFVKTPEFKTTYIDFLRNKDNTKRRGVRQTPKKNNTIISYVSVINYFIQEFNEENPFNQLPTISIRKIGRRESQPDNSPKLSDIKQLIEFQPHYISKHKHGTGVTSEDLFLAKEMFLFQFFCTGLRLSDTIILRTKQFSKNGIAIQMKKTKDNLYILPDFHIARHLGSFHPKLYNEAKTETTLGMIDFSADDMMNFIFKMSFDKKIREFNLDDLERYIAEIQKKINHKQELIQFLERCSDMMKAKIAEEFFLLISKLPNQFVFPFLNNDVFKKVKNINEIDYSEEMLKEITRGKNLYNNRLKRLSVLMDCNFKFSSHQARHAFANLMHEANASVEEISLNLGHRHISTTMKYLKRFPSNIRKMGLEKFSSITKSL